MSSVAPGGSDNGKVPPEAYTKTQLKSGYATAEASRKAREIDNELQIVERKIEALESAKTHVDVWRQMRAAKLLSPVLDLLLAPARSFRNRMWDMTDDELLAERRFAKRCFDQAKAIRELSISGGNIDKKLADLELTRVRLRRVTGRMD